MKSILFDLDGTIINTEPIHAKAMLDALNVLELEIEEDQFVNRFHGACDYDVWKELVHNSRQAISFKQLIEIKNSYFKKIIEQEKREKIKQLLTPGIELFIQKLIEKKIRFGLVTASDQLQTEIILKKIEFDHYFQYRCVVGDTFFSKPNPAPYFFMMRKLMIDSSKTIIFEDSLPGLSAALLTGAKVLAVSPSDRVKQIDKLTQLNFIKDFEDAYVKDFIFLNDSACIN